MRRTLVSLIILGSTLLLAASASPQAEQPKPVVATTFLISGKGWGHGAGMAQWGARGFAEQEGFTFEQILGHYYPGTELKRAQVTKVRVLLADGVKRLKVSSEAPFRVRDAAATTYDLPAGELALGPDLTLSLNGAPSQLQGPLVFQPGKGAFLALDGKPYRGELQVVSTGKALTAVDFVGLEQYLRSVVPGEMPGDWPPEALKAQAVAARTYALSQLVKGKSFDLYADVRSQVYLGLPGEDTRTTAAVKATAGRALFYGGKPAIALFSSSSGGQTADGAEVLSGPQPYLVSVPDPYDTPRRGTRGGRSPSAPRKLRSALKLTRPPLDLKVVPSATGRARAVNVTMATGRRHGLGRRAALRARAALDVDHDRDAVAPALERPGRLGRRAHAHGLGSGCGGRLAPGPRCRRRLASGRRPRPCRGRDLLGHGQAGRDDRLPPGRCRRARADAEGARRAACPPRPCSGARRAVRHRAPRARRRSRRDPAVRGRRLADSEPGVHRRAGVILGRVELVPGTYRAWVAPGQGLAEGISPELEVGAT